MTKYNNNVLLLIVKMNNDNDNNNNSSSSNNNVILLNEIWNKNENKINTIFIFICKMYLNKILILMIIIIYFTV